MDLFAGVAPYYDKYRPGLPDELVQRLVAEASRFSLAHSLLDIGTGTGRVLEQLLPYFKDVVVVEPQTEMLDYAKRRLIPHMSAETSIYFLDGSAELVQFPPNWSASLVTICRAFHWMDQAKVLKRLNEVVEARGVIAILGDHSLWEGDNPWMNAVKKIVQAFLGEERRADDGLFNPSTQAYVELLQQSAFSNIETFSMSVTRTWSSSQILGYLYSISFAAPRLFGDQREAFEQALKEKLHRLLPNDRFVEQNEFSVILARRPLAGL